MKSTFLLMCAAALLLAGLIAFPDASVGVNMFGLFIVGALIVLAFLAAASTVSRNRQADLDRINKGYRENNVSYIRTQQGAYVAAKDWEEKQNARPFGIGFHDGDAA